jgi:riboflavin transporter FmnP
MNPLRKISLIGILSGLAYLLYVFRLPGFVFFPSYLEINLSEVILFLVGFAYGWKALLFSLLFRYVVALPFSSTSLIGETADFIYSFVFIVPSSILYGIRRKKESVFIGFFIGFILQLIVTSLLNALVVTDLYLNLFFGGSDAFLNFIQQTNPQVVDPYFSLVLWVYLPFNTIKNTIIIIVTLMSYKRVHQLLKKINHPKQSPRLGN